ncbi:Phenylalanyl-tRNA synthetase beta chain [Gemmatirosa kalamazoonensis]|uniref:Phenylalanine--tRNA ligase beta subunit n=1 Tax=Gemmatirosa kalamazoonensis TaxID=861299 RepID=W0RJM5_9BACT|nr:phenylalanine--tRNA ligase subunit beta [Gemmatirosa kalamazoonensis]AHG90981.1 Phenylalanyl-tRNA synthetase beta chain [Gemmatirosa kalamazoonensis]
MNVSYDWVRAFVPHTLTPKQLGELLSAHVATLDGLESLRSDLAPFVVGQVVHSERIPETRLSFNRVDDGSGQLLEVVCGAPNVAVGAKYPLARVGTVIPGKGGITIERRKIRGFTSAGMLCSAMELGLGEDHEGILELATEAAPGTPLVDVLPTGDTRLDLDVLPNRPDLLSQRGVAREVAALTGVAIVDPPELGRHADVASAARDPKEASAAGVTVRIDDTEGCPRYCAAVIRGVRVGPSPEWLVQRLAAVGARSINNVVDATNYCLHGLGQPMHAFDLAKLGDRVVVRRARAGEKLVTLDGVERALSPDVLAIAGAERAEAIAGVIGGQGSEVSEGTTDVLLEVAYFDPRRVRRGRMLANVSTDASYRFERGVDRAATLELLAAGAGLIVSLAGGAVEGVIDVGRAPGALPAVPLRAARLARVLGAPVADADVERLLRAIGFDVARSGEGAWTVSPPTWRQDVEREADLIEEVARLVGFDALPTEIRPFRPGRVPDDPMFLLADRVRAELVGAGLLEARPLPFVAGDDAHVRVQNPLAEDEPHLRREVLETLARRAEHNLARMHGDVRLFEIGHVFRPHGERPDESVHPSLPDERMHVGVLIMGARRPVHFSEPHPPAFDEWDAKAIAERVAAAGHPGHRVDLVPVGEDDVLWRIDVDGESRGTVRRVRLDLPPWAAQPFGVELELMRVQSAVVAEPGSNAWGSVPPIARVSHVQYRELPTTPAVVFDLALLVPDATPASRVEEVIRVAVGELLEQLVLFDVFRGGDVPAGTRSLAWRLTLRDPQRTLRDKEVEGRRTKLLRALEGELGVRQRAS